MSAENSKSKRRAKKTAETPEDNMSPSTRTLQPRVNHRKFGDKSRMPLSSEETGDAFLLDGE